MAENTDTNMNASSTKESGAQGLKDLIERAFMAGMGAAAVTKDRVQDLVDDLVKKGQIDADEGREVLERLVSRSREEARTVLKKADSSLQSAYRGLGLGSKHDLEEIDLRIEQLEHRVRLLEERADSGGMESE